MKKIALFFITIILSTLLPLGHAALESSPYEQDLKIISEDAVVGTVQVWDNGTSIHVKYSITAEDWILTKTHLHIVTITDDIPLKPNGNPNFGKFFKANDNPGATETEFVISLSDLGIEPGTDVFIVAHAVVKDSASSGNNSVNGEDAWGAGIRFGDLEYMEYTLENPDDGAPGDPAPGDDELPAEDPAENPAEDPAPEGDTSPEAYETTTSISCNTMLVFIDTAQTAYWNGYSWIPNEPVVYGNIGNEDPIIVEIEYNSVIRYYTVAPDYCLLVYFPE